MSFECDGLYRSLWSSLFEFERFIMSFGSVMGFIETYKSLCLGLKDLICNLGE